MKKIDIFESAFNLDFKSVIEKFHFEEKRSILWIAKKGTVSRDFVYKTAEKFNLKLFSSKQAALNKKLFFKHPMLGKTKENSAWARNCSDRMKRKNPAKNAKTRERMSASMAKTFKKNPLKQESIFIQILSQLGVEYKFQEPIGPFVMDFFISSKKACIEIDSTYKWGIERRTNAENRDLILDKKYGIKTIRINKAKLSDHEFIFNILKLNNII